MDVIRTFRGIECKLGRAKRVKARSTSGKSNSNTRADLLVRCVVKVLEYVATPLDGSAAFTVQRTQTINSRGKSMFSNFSIVANDNNQP